MARPRKPTNVLELNGAHKKNPARGRERENEPKPVNPIGEAPAEFASEQKAAWNDIVKQCHEGVLTSVDRLIVEIGANLLAEYRLNPIMFPSAKLNQLRGVLAQCGMTPADRSRVGVVGGKKPKGDFDEF